MVKPTSIEVPGDKSIGHRSLLLAALANGRSRLEGVPHSEDVKSMAAALRVLGVEVSPVAQNRVVTVAGVGFKGFSRPQSPVFCGNAGTAVRLLMGVAAGQPFVTVLSGDDSLSKRPMRRVTKPLMAMGAQIKELNGDGLPVEIHGGDLRELRYESPVASAQVKSAILLAGLVGGVHVSVVEPYPSRDHTERMLQFLGVPVRRGSAAEVAIDRSEGFEGFDAVVPGDPSSAAFLLGAAIISGRRGVCVENVCLNEGRIGFVGCLKRMGAHIEFEQTGITLGEPIGQIRSRPSELTATEVWADEIPSLIDEIPLLAVLACHARGTTIFHDVGELRWKESDRLNLLVENIRSVGGSAEIDGDDLIVHEMRRPAEGKVETAGDHRMAMAFATFFGVRNASVELSETASPSISFPGFFGLLDSVINS
ncbi:MAG: 3-phosphoshikimate 1-carboxyvinyltransferase [Gemmatimonadota bacterium]|nr:3-phosphoshikimate 1-carboxyvinyltransferase [Gemmatimonadota bacterium]